MKGYRKIGSGSLHCSTMFARFGDNYELDDQIRAVVHSSILGENETSECQEYYVVVYKKTGASP